MSTTLFLDGHRRALIGVRLTLILGACLVGYGMPARAEEMAETIRALKAEVARLNARIEELERRYTRDRQASAGSAESKRKETPTTVASAEPRAARAKRSTVTIPGIDTRVQLGGRVKLDVIYNSTSVGGPGGTNLGDITLLPGAIPVGGSGEDGQISLSARESRFWLTSRTATDYGALSTNLELDFLAAQSSGDERVGNSHTPRLRHAYGVLGKLLLGQTWTTFMNVGSFPELNDSVGGPVGIIDVRQPQIRWTEPFSWGEWQIALEQPETTLTDPAGNRVTPDDDRLPDLVSKLVFEDGWGQFSLAGMLRQIRSDGAVVAGSSDEVMGGALSLGGRLRTFEQDNLRFNLNYGSALGRYIGLNVFNEGSIDGRESIELSEVVGGFVAYQHWWDPTLRSTLSYSRLYADNDLSRVPRTVTEWVESLHANLLWSPVPSATFGIEYIYARRVLEDGQDGDIDRVQFSTIYTF